MNRILQAEVILTLTLEQASRVAAVVSFYQGEAVSKAGEQGVLYRDALRALLDQCVKQGVRL